MKQWGWLLGVVIIAATLPVLWPHTAQSATAGHRRHVNATPLPEAAMISGGRMAVPVGPTDWQQPFEILKVRIGMTMAEARVAYASNPGRPAGEKASVVRRADYTVESRVIGGVNWLTIVYDDTYRVVQVEGTALWQGRRLVAVDDRNVVPHHPAAPESPVITLGPPDEVLDDAAGGISVWYQDPVTIRFYAKTGRFVVTSGFSDPI